MAIPRWWCAAALLTAFAVGGAAPATAAPTDEPPPDPASAPAPDPVLLAEVPGAEAPPLADPFVTASEITKQSPVAAFADMLAQASPDVVLRP
ncbi:MAG: hypothetical protein NT146_15015, partial [Mycobacterium sp.]|nr:hypothetical protein [Mycobacterium sp.]